jgi:hypothetical protein
MTLAQLLEAMNAAKAALEAKPEDEALKTKYEEAKAAYEAKKAEEEGDDEDEDSLDESSLDEKTKKYIAKLRKENGNHRTKAKDLKSKLQTSEEQKKAILKAAGIEFEDEKPEEKLKSLSAQNEQLLFEKALSESALSHGIPAEGFKYYKFLMTEALGELDEGEELSDERIDEIVQEAKGFKGGKKPPANSSVNGGGNGGGNPPPPKKEGDNVVTLDKFLAMGTLAKSDLYLKSRALYEQLYAEAKAKKKLV